MPNKTKVGYGAKANIAAAIESEKLDAMDFVITSDTNEIAFINENKEANFLKDRTTQAYTLNGTTLGALANGATVPSGITMDEFINMITQKPIPATYTKSTVSIGNNDGQAAGTVEAGTSITPKLRATFTKNDSEGLTSIKITKNGTEVASGTASPLDYTGDAYVIGDETLTFKASADYKAAVVKNNNLGQESKENWFDAGTATSSEYKIVGGRQLFYGTGVGAVPEVTSDFVRGLANKKMSPAANTTFTINVAVGQQYIAFAYPATIRDVNNVTYVEANDSGMAGNFTKTTIEVADARGGENGLKSYKVYTYAMAVPAAAAMTFTVKL